MRRRAAWRCARSAKDVWLADRCGGALTLVAEVYAFDPSVRAAYLDTTRAFFNGPSVFVWPVGREDRPCELEILPPAGEAYRNWRVATAMPRAARSLSASAATAPATMTS